MCVSVPYACQVPKEVRRRHHLLLSHVSSSHGVCLVAKKFTMVGAHSYGSVSL